MSCAVDTRGSEGGVAGPSSKEPLFEVVKWVRWLVDARQDTMLPEERGEPKWRVLHDALTEVVQ